VSFVFSSGVATIAYIGLQSRHVRVVGFGVSVHVLWLLCCMPTIYYFILLQQQHNKAQAKVCFKLKLKKVLESFRETLLLYIYP
jgi:hypothetical protein